MSYRLLNAEEEAGLDPSIVLPDAADRSSLRPGDYARLRILPGDQEVLLKESLWVTVESTPGVDGMYTGSANEAGATGEPAKGERLSFGPSHVTGLIREGAKRKGRAEVSGSSPWLLLLGLGVILAAWKLR